MVEIPSGYVKLLKMAIEIVNLPIENGGSFRFAMLSHQRVLLILGEMFNVALQEIPQDENSMNLM